MIRLARLRRWLRPPRRLRPTAAGWSFFALTFGVGFAALNTGNNLLYLVLSLMLAFLVLSGVLSESALRGIAVRRRLPRELFAATPAAVGLEITNRQRRIPAFALVVEDRVLERAGASAGALRTAGCCFVLRAGPGATVRRAYGLEPNRRGDLFFEQFRVSTRFPFGLFSKSLELPASARALVYPSVERLAPTSRRRAVREAGADAAGERGRGTLASGLRPYVRGDPLRRVHWPSSLRRRELLVREIEDDEHREIEVRLRTAGRERDDGFESAVGWAASEIVAWLAVGSRVGLRTDGVQLAAAAGPGQRSRLLTYLARVEPGCEPDDAS